MYINTKTKQYPITEGDIKALFPNVSFPFPFVAPTDYVWVFPAPSPTYDALSQFVRELAPVLAKGNYQQVWEVVDLDPEQAEENNAKALQAKREGLVVTPWQIRKALNAAGLREAVEAGVAQADVSTKDAWEFAQEFKRLDPLVTGLGTMLGKTELELDTLFELAVTL